MRLCAFRLARTWLLALGFAAFWWLYVGDCRAFCRTTTCDVGQKACAQDKMGCSVEGVPLTWDNHCVGVQVGAGSVTRHITAGQVERVVDSALRTWSQASCGHEQGPSFAFYVSSSVQSLGTGLDGQNAVHFRDQDWPHHDLHSNVALTTLSIDRRGQRRDLAQRAAAARGRGPTGPCRRRCPCRATLMVGVTLTTFTS